MVQECDRAAWYVGPDLGKTERSELMSRELKKQLESLGFGVGATLESVGHLLTIRDVLGGPMMNLRAGVAVAIRAAGKGVKVGFCRRNGTGWLLQHEEEAQLPSGIKKAVLTITGSYYKAVGDYAIGAAAPNAA
jgi:hypothetical protein